ncbi:MAG: spermidine/putrescine ABC transporter substrate-binding protein [Gemmatimonadaceae bacterium]|nr:spermidine/putrescine ABC transporter substrate-binding protein [Gemmatimonadaceae bacterium]
MSRRVQISIFIALVAVLVALAGCSSKKEEKPQATPPEPPKPAAPAELSLFIWSEYIDEKVVAEFEKKENARVRITTYESTEEMEGKLSYSGADAQYDVVVAASQVVARFARKGLIAPLDHSKLPNLKNLAPRFSGPEFDNGNKYAVPYQWGTVGLFYDKKKLPNLDPSWAVVLDPKKTAGTFVLIDEMRDMLGSVLKYMGRSSNSTSPEDLREAGRILQEAKGNPKCLGFKGMAGVQDVKSGTADIAVMWNGFALKEVSEQKDRYAYVLPKEGSIIWVDTFVIPAKAPKPELAYKFLNFLLEPQIGARLSAFVKYASPNAASKPHIVPEDLANPVIYPPEDAMSRLEGHRDLGDAIKLFDEAWTTVKSR